MTRTPSWWPLADPPHVEPYAPEGDSWLEEECIRVSSNIECSVCGLPYWRHVSVSLEAPSLVRACDGRLLKL